MTKTLRKQTKKKGRKDKVDARKKAKAQALENLCKSPVSNPKNSPTAKDDKPSDVAPHPTDDNGNSHFSKSSQSLDEDEIGYEESYCEVAEKSKDKLVIEKPNSSSFYVVRDSLHKLGLDDEETAARGPL